MTKVAIITRTKDRPVFLARALESVAGQSFTNYVHVIVNDGGDKTAVDAAVIGLKPEQKAKTRVFHREASSNAPDTIFTESVDRVQSRYFAIHDDDDTWHEDFLEQTVTHLDANGQLGAVVVHTDKINEVVDGENIKFEKKTRWMPDLRVISLYRQCIDNQFTPISTLFKREAYEKVGKFDSTLPIVGDWEFGVRLLQKYDVDFIDPGYALAEYHHRSNSDNSFAMHDHRYYTNIVMNRYLREELAAGKFGVGHIMSKLKYDQGRMSTIVNRVLPNFIVKHLKIKVQN